jgi:succinylarginine dihydrolase
VAQYLSQLLASGGAIDELIDFDLRQSMRNGGGPACLRLRVVLDDAQAAAMHQGVIMTEALYATLVGWVGRHYRDRLEPQDLQDPLFALECSTALEELERLLDLPGLYDLS